MKKSAQPGYVLILTLLMLTLAIALTTNIFNTGSVHGPYARTIVDRQKARMLALGGLQIAMSSLNVKLSQKQKEQEKKNKDLKTKLHVARMLPIINRLQHFAITQKSEGVDGEIGLTISSEHGKLNINELYDFKNKKFIGQGQPKGDMKKASQAIFQRIQKILGGKNLFPPFEQYLKKRARPLDDVTQLLEQKEFHIFSDKLFYHPPREGDKNNTSKLIFLNDIFTVFTANKELSPWLLSNSWCKLLGLQSALPGDISKRAELTRTWIKNFKLRASSWQSDWDMALKPVYRKDFKQLPRDIVPLLSVQFESDIFSVLSYGKVGKITQRVYAILEKKKRIKKGNEFPFIVRKLYWL